jgi:hypothetical protein
MKLPDFRRRNQFLDDIDIPCLVAKVKNSTLPKVASLHIVKYKKDPVCEILVRSSSTKELSGWPKEVLQELLEQEKLAFALEEGMKEYESSSAWPGYFKEDAQNYGDIKTHGIVPHMTVEAIVVDEIKREVILVCDTEWDVHLSEHGIAISLRDGRWRFNYEDYLSEYQGDVEDGEAERLWSMARLPGESKGEDETDTSFIFGTWEFDANESRALLERMRCSQKVIEEAGTNYARVQYHISQVTYRQITGPQPTQQWNYVFVGCDRRGEQVVIRFKDVHRKEVYSEIFYYQNGLLMNLDGLVLRRKE